MKTHFTKGFLVIVLCILVSLSSKGQTLVDSELIKTYTPEELALVLEDFVAGVGDLGIDPSLLLNNLDITYSVNVYKVTYMTDHPATGPILASGAVTVPQNVGCDLPMAVYQHGTVFNPTGVPSNLSFEHYIGAILSGGGYMVLMPDYIGLGESPGMHPYVHTRTESDCALDLMRTVRDDLQDELEISWNDQLFIFGYSQGGHGAMALFWDIETNFSNEFTVTAAAPMSGPYDLSESQANVMWDFYETPGYLPYTLLGFRSVYPELLADYPDPFIEEFDLFNNFEGNSADFSAILSSYDLPDVPSEMFKESMLEGYNSDDNHPLKVALRENDVYDWTPQAPVQIMGCCDDEQVMIESAYVAYDKFIENGAQNVELFDFCETISFVDVFRHDGCVPWCLLQGLSFFNGLKESCVTGIEDQDEVTLRYYPNPANYELFVSLPEFGNSLNSVSLFDLSGRMVMQENNVQGPIFKIDVSQFKSGTYILDVKGETANYRSKVILAQ